MSNNDQHGDYFASSLQKAYFGENNMNKQQSGSNILSLIDEISNIEKYSVGEEAGIKIDPKFITMRDSMDYFMSGFKVTASTGVVSILLIPVAVSVLMAKLPIFGTTLPTLYDKTFAFCLSLGWNIGLMFLFAYAAKNYSGELTRKMINNLLTGMTVGIVLKFVLAFIIYNLLYFKILEPNNLFHMLTKITFSQTMIPFMSKFYNLLIDIRESLPSSTMFILLTSIIFIVVPWAVVFVKYRKMQKGRELSELIRK